MRNIILGTDWGADSDDAVAIRLLARYARAKKINFLGIGINCCKEHAYASMMAYLEREGVCVPVGIDTDECEFEWEETYQLRLASYKPELTNQDAEDAVRVYRRAIANAEGKVEILEVGFLQTLAKLLESKGDDISSKTGMELVKEKVSKIWIMGGKWDEQGGLEFNLSKCRVACEGSSKTCKLCPVPITFLGWEIGSQLITGDNLEDGDTLKQILCDHGNGNGRESWDPMLAMLALIGDEETAGYKTVTGRATVDAKTGRNYFEKDENGLHKFVIKTKENSYYTDMINKEIAN